MILTLRLERKRESGIEKGSLCLYKQKSKGKKRDVKEQSSCSAAVYWQGCLNPREMDLNSCSGDFYSPESDPPHKIMRYWVYYSI
jgi:hypothetical protein